METKKDILKGVTKAEGRVKPTGSKAVKLTALQRHRKLERLEKAVKKATGHQAKRKAKEALKSFKAKGQSGRAAAFQKTVKRAVRGTAKAATTVISRTAKAPGGIAKSAKGAVKKMTGGRTARPAASSPRGRMATAKAKQKAKRAALLERGKKVRAKRKAAKTGRKVSRDTRAADQMSEMKRRGLAVGRAISSAASPPPPKNRSRIKKRTTKRNYTSGRRR